MATNTTIITRGVHKFIFQWEDGLSQEVLQMAGRWAANPELSFTWWDAAKFTREVEKALRAARKEEKQRKRWARREVLRVLKGRVA